MQQTARQYNSSQAEQLQTWVENRKRERRVQIIPKTDTQHEMELVKIEGVMDGIGITVGVMTVTGILALLVHYVSWWTLPAIASAAVLGWWIRKARHVL